MRRGGGFLFSNLHVEASFEAGHPAVEVQDRFQGQKHPLTQSAAAACY